MHALKARYRGRMRKEWTDGRRPDGAGMDEKKTVISQQQSALSVASCLTDGTLTGPNIGTMWGSNGVYTHLRCTRIGREAEIKEGGGDDKLEQNDA